MEKQGDGKFSLENIGLQNMQTETSIVSKPRHCKSTQIPKLSNKTGLQELPKNRPRGDTLGDTSTT
jgi:hypothetical protein